VRKSLLAGIIGLAVVILFMLLYYPACPVFVADPGVDHLRPASRSLFFKLVADRFSRLPGIAGFHPEYRYGRGTANILIFETHEGRAARRSAPCSRLSISVFRRGLPVPSVTRTSPR